MQSNWSQTTLVNPDTRAILTFSKPLNCITSTLWLDDRPYLKVATTDSAGACTTVTDLASSEVLLTIRRRKLHPNSVTFSHKYEGRSVKQKDWLVVGKTENGRKQWAVHTSHGTFVWKRNTTYRLALYPDKSSSVPLVYAQFPTSAYPSTPLALILSHGTETFWDEIIASFLILEEEIRTEARDIISSALFFSDSI